MMNKKGQLGVIGIIAMILIIDGLTIYGFSAIGNDIQQKDLREFGYGDSNCDCGTITCAEYKLIHGEQAMNDICSKQASSQSSFTVDVISGFKSVPVIGYIIFVFNIVLILCIVIILRGGTG